MELQDAEFPRFGQHSLPLRCGQLLAVVREIERVGAVRAVERAGVGELCQHAVRLIHRQAPPNAWQRVERGNSAPRRRPRGYSVRATPPRSRRPSAPRRTGSGWSRLSDSGPAPPPAQAAHAVSAPGPTPFWPVAPDEADSWMIL